METTNKTPVRLLGRSASQGEFDRASRGQKSTGSVMEQRRLSASRPGSKGVLTQEQLEKLKEVTASRGGMRSFKSNSVVSGLNKEPLNLKTPSIHGS